MRALAFVACGVLCAACETDDIFDCTGHCEKNRIILVSDGNDAAALCDRPSLQGASTCSECRDAFDLEFGLATVKQMCTCPREGDEIVLFDDVCLESKVEPTAENCSELDSFSQQDLAKRCN